MKREDFLKIIAVVSLLAIFVLSYSTLQMQSIGLNILAQDALIEEPSGTNGAISQVTLETPKISFVSILDSSNSNLVQLTPLVEQLKTIGIEVVSEKTLEFSSEEAKQLIKKYGIEKIPTILISGETQKVSVLTQNWGKLGTTENDGTLVLRNVPPVYLDLNSNSVRGLVNAVYLGVPDRNEVFPAVLFKQVLGNAFGMAPAEETEIDYNSSEGRAIIEKFQLAKLPTVILSGDLNAYQNFETIWKEAGSKEADGSFVFRNPELLQGLKYLDLDTNQIVEAAAGTA